MVELPPAAEQNLDHVGDKIAQPFHSEPAEPYTIDGPLRAGSLNSPTPTVATPGAALAGEILSAVWNGAFRRRPGHIKGCPPSPAAAVAQSGAIEARRRRLVPQVDRHTPSAELATATTQITLPLAQPSATGVTRPAVPW